LSTESNEGTARQSCNQRIDHKGEQKIWTTEDTEKNRKAKGKEEYIRNDPERVPYPESGIDMVFHLQPARQMVRMGDVSNNYFCHRERRVLRERTEGNSNRKIAITNHKNNGESHE